MKAFFLLLIAAYCPAAFAQARPDAPDKGQVAAYAGRDLTLERGALAQRDKLDGMLPVWARRKLGLVSKKFLKRLLSDAKPVEASKVAREELGREFAALTPRQSELLSFHLVAGVVKSLPPHADGKDPGDVEDSVGEMNEADMLMLQQLMEKKGQLESMISNTMKAGFEGAQAALQSLKAS
jgi:hypothetical protein